MSWFLIVPLIVFYIAMWIITTIAFTRWAKNSNAGWLVVGAIWPLTLICIPLVAVIWFVVKIVDKYGYRESKANESA